MFKQWWAKFDGLKTFASIIGAVLLYGIPWARLRWPLLPWDEFLIPILVSLGLIGGGHKIVKHLNKNKVTIN